jgi:chemotaxis protein CheD
MPDRAMKQHHQTQNPSIRMGEIAIGRGAEALKSLLGSCIGLALYDRTLGIGGLAHIVLPSSEGHTGPPGKFVDTAIPELIRLIAEMGGQTKDHLAAKLAGGAQMFQTNAAMTVGDRNLETIEQELLSHRIPILGKHCGGTSGRRMTFYPGTGRVVIEVVGAESIEF